MSNVKELLERELEDELDNLQTMQLGSPEYEKTLKGISVLTDKLVAIEAQDVRKDEIKKSHKLNKKKLKHAKKADKKAKKHEKKKNKKAEEMEKRSWLTNLGLGAAGILIPSGIMVWGAKHSWKFEEEGSYTSSTSRQFLNKLFKK